MRGLFRLEKSVLEHRRNRSWKTHIHFTFHSLLLFMRLKEAINRPTSYSYPQLFNIVLQPRPLGFNITTNQFLIFIMNEPSESRPPSPITDAEDVLDEISHRAQLELQSQSFHTQVNLVKQTRRIFDHYTKRGTATSLHNAISRYFKPKTEDNADLTFYPPLPPDYTPPAPDPKDSRMVDDESKPLVRGMPFLVDRKLHIRPNVKIPEGFLEGIDRIFRIYQAQAEAMLRHHCEKYGEEAIFRVGVRSLILR